MPAHRNVNERPPQPPEQQRYGEIAPRLHANDYRPLPLVYGQKNPVPTNWPGYAYEAADANKYSRRGTGCLTQLNPAVDIDVLDAAVAQELDDLAVRMLGPAPVRVGQPPKRLRPYRLEGEPFAKIETCGYHFPGDARDAKPHHVEFLAAGQQFVAYNKHPATGRPYTWSGGDPLSVPASQLTPVNKAKAQAFIAECERILATHGMRVSEWQRVDEGRERASNEKLLADDPAVAREALQAIPNKANEVGYDDWVYIGLAAKGALGDAGFEAFDTWSKQSAKYNSRTTHDKWRTFKPTRIGAGTLYYLAQRLGGWQRKVRAQGVIEQVNAKHALIRVSGKVFVMWRDRAEWNEGVNFPALSSVEDARRIWLPEQLPRHPNPIDEWLGSKERAEYSGIVFQPGVANTGRKYNLFHGWSVQPVQGDCSLFLKHLRTVVCNGDETLCEYVIQWLANIVQRPQDKPGTSIALGGIEGSGKGAIIRYLRPILNPYVSHVSGSEQLTGRWTDIFAGKLLIFGDEVAWPGDRRSIDKLKAYITEEFITVERKFQPAFEIRNLARLITATNREHTAPVDISDRRWVAVNVSPRMVGNRAYWEALEAERSGGGPAALLYHLLHEVKITCDLRTNPKTAAHTEQKLLGLDDIGQFWREALMSNDHSLWEGYGENMTVIASWEFGTVVPTTTLHQFYLDFAKRNRLRYTASIDALGKGLRRYVPELAKREARAEEQREQRLPARTMVYVLPPIAQAREAFEQAVGSGVQWLEVRDAGAEGHLPF